MTELGARATSVRRTVTVATALVMGQALLCAVIGWVTFDGDRPPAQSTARAPAPLPGSPIVVAPSSATPIPARWLSSSQRAAPSSPTGSTPERTSEAPRSSPPAPAPGSTGSLDSTGSTGSTAAAPLLPSSSPAEAVLALRPTPSAAEVHGNVVVGDECNPLDARGVTVDDIAVRCDRDSDGDLIWQII